MCAETSVFSEGGLDETLGSIGSNLVASLFGSLCVRGGWDALDTLVADLEANGEDVTDPRDLAVYYGDGAVVGGESTGGQTAPFYFELAAVPRTDGFTHTLFGINQSVAYSEPDLTLPIKHTAGEQRHRSISAAFKAIGSGFHVVANLTCPNIDFQDKGKQSFERAPFEETIADVVGTAVRKIEREILRSAIR